jgi:beta-lactamase class D
VPVYQEIARRIGAERMQKYVDLFDYGNRDIGGGIDQFWLTGNLRIDPDPADRFRRPAAPRRAAGVEAQPGIDARYLPVTKVGDATIRAKSGLLGAEQGKPSLGWMVGWVEKGSSATVFAMNMDCKEQSHIAARMTVVQQCLADIVAY